MQSERNARKTGKTNSGFSFTAMLQTHRSAVVNVFLAEENVTTMENLTPADFCVFPGFKSALNRWRFCDATDIIKNATAELKRLSKNDFQK
jgi:hypothetical protein